MSNDSQTEESERLSSSGQHVTVVGPGGKRSRDTDDLDGDYKLEQSSTPLTEDMRERKRAKMSGEGINSPESPDASHET